MAPSTHPQTVSDVTWYYESQGSILVVHDVNTDQGVYLKTVQFRIPWRMLEVSYQRRRKRKKPQP